jgi:hypothetical protein
MAETPIKDLLKVLAVKYGPDLVKLLFMVLVKSEVAASGEDGIYDPLADAIESHPQNVELMAQLEQLAAD